MACRPRNTGLTRCTLQPVSVRNALPSPGVARALQRGNESLFSVVSDLQRVLRHSRMSQLEDVADRDPAYVVLSPAMLEAVRLLDLYAPAETTVVFWGETGTGKTHLARLLHARSGRPGPFREMAGGELLDSGLAPDQLFGHVRGAFTGAQTSRGGIIAEAAGGTLLFDDFQLLRAWQQYLLLRVLDEQLYRRVGSDRDAPVGCRLVFGMCEHPDDLVAQGKMLKDVRYRLEHCIVRVPPLEERREEIVLLAQHFLARCPAETRVTHGPQRFTKEAITALEAASYPGNVRDLKGRVKAAYLHAQGEEAIGAHHLPGDGRGSVRFDPQAEHGEKLRVVAWALWRTNDCVNTAAALLGVHRNTVSALRAELGRKERRHARGEDGFAVDAP